jgi:hypothetical protein
MIMIGSPRKGVAVRGAHSSKTATSGAASVVVVPEEGWASPRASDRMIMIGSPRKGVAVHGAHSSETATSGAASVVVVPAEGWASPHDHDRVASKRRRGPSSCPLVENRDEWGSLSRGSVGGRVGQPPTSIVVGVGKAELHPRGETPLYFQ